MKWAGMVNNLRSAAEEVVLREIVDRVRTDKANQKIRGKIRGFFDIRKASEAVHGEAGGVTARYA